MIITCEKDRSAGKDKWLSFLNQSVARRIFCGGYNFLLEILSLSCLQLFPSKAPLHCSAPHIPLNYTISALPIPTTCLECHTHRASLTNSSRAKKINEIGGILAKRGEELWGGGGGRGFVIKSFTVDNAK